MVTGHDSSDRQNSSLIISHSGVRPVVAGSPKFFTGSAKVAWTQNRLQKIASSDDLHIAPLRDDGVTYGTPTWIWSVVVDEDLYVRAYNGTGSRWYNAALKQKAGQITAAGKTTDVSFDLVEGAMNDRIDAAYRTKYSSSPYLRPMIGDHARAATVRIIPKN